MCIDAVPRRTVWKHPRLWRNIWLLCCVSQDIWRTLSVADDILQRRKWGDGAGELKYDRILVGSVRSRHHIMSRYYFGDQKLILHDYQALCVHQSFRYEQSPFPTPFAALSCRNLINVQELWCKLYMIIIINVINIAWYNIGSCRHPNQCLNRVTQKPNLNLFYLFEQQSKSISNKLRNGFT